MGKRTKCFCGKYSEITDMLRIRDSGLIRNVLSPVCRNCPNGALDVIRKHYAIVCAGCKEVVRVDEPYVERRTGFKWEAGKCYHVPNCPSCLNRVIRSSPVIEQKIYYRERGFPYPDDGET